MFAIKEYQGTLASFCRLVGGNLLRAPELVVEKFYDDIILVHLEVVAEVCSFGTLDAKVLGLDGGK